MRPRPGTAVTLRGVDRLVDVGTIATEDKHTVPVTPWMNPVLML